MKNLLTILLLLPVIAYGQIVHEPGEGVMAYPMFRNNTNFLLPGYGYRFDAASSQALAVTYATGTGYIETDATNGIDVSAGTKYLDGVKFTTGNATAIDGDFHTLIVNSLMGDTSVLIKYKTTDNDGRLFDSDNTDITIAKENGASNYTDCDIFEVRIYSDTINPSAISTNPIRWWLMHPDSCYDVSGNNAHMTSNNFDANSYVTDDAIQNPMNLYGYNGYKKPTSLSEDSLIAAYNMTLDGDTVRDISGNDVYAINYGSSPVSEGLYFDGVDDYLDLDDNIEINGVEGFTYLMRIDGANFDSEYDVIFFNDSYIGDYHLILNRGAGYIRTPSSATLFNYIPDLPTGIFNFVLVYNPTTELLKIYIDGIEAYSGSHAFLSENFEIGSIFRDSSTGSINAYGGVVEDLRIFNRVLTEQEILQYNEFWKTKPFDASTIDDFGTATKDIFGNDLERKIIKQ